MAETKSLKAEILERLNLHKGGQSTASANIRKASHDFAKSDAPQFRGRSQKKRHEMAVAAGLAAARGESAAPKTGDKAIYEGKNVIIRSLNETGMAVVRFGNNHEVIVRAIDLKPVAKEQLTEAFLGMAAIAPTWREPTNYGFMKLPGLDPEDIGLIYEDDDTGEQDEQEEDNDNGSNVRSNGHTGKKEVDALPTPSDTIAPAYSDEKAPKEISSPLSIHTGAEEGHLWDAPEWDGYDYPADAPEIPTAEFDGDDMGNSRAPHFDSDEHQPGDKGEDYHEDDEGADGDDDGDGDDDRTDEAYVGFDKLKSKIAHKGGVSNPGAVAAAIGRKKYGEKKFQHAATTGHKLGEGEVTDPARKDNSKDLTKMRKDIDIVSERRFGDDDDQQQAQKEKGPKWQGNKDRGRARQQKEKERMGWMDESTLAARQPFDDDENPQKEKGPKWQGNKDRGRARQQKEKERMGWMDESFFMSEMDAMLDGSDTEPRSGDTITVTLPAMAAIVCTVAHKVGHDYNLLKAIVEALAEVSKGKTIDVGDLQAVAAHINGEEMPEMQNREDGRPDHEGIQGEEGDHEEGGHNDGSEWPGDMDKTKSGKNKLLDCGNPMQESNYFNSDDVMEGTELSEEDELRIVKRRAGLRFW